LLSGERYSSKFFAAVQQGVAQRGAHARVDGDAGRGRLLAARRHHGRRTTRRFPDSARRPTKNAELSRRGLASRQQRDQLASVLRRHQSEDAGHSHHLLRVRRHRAADSRPRRVLEVRSRTDGQTQRIER